MTRLLISWLMRAWPVLAIAGLVTLHFTALGLLPTLTVWVNKITGTLMQVVGGLLVLHSIDGNLGTFRKQSIPLIVKLWLLDFPLRKRTVSGSINVALGGATAHAVGGSVRIKSTSLEGRVTEVERRIEELQVALQTQDAAVRKKIDDMRTELSTSIDSNQSAVRQLREQIESSTVGGFKEQAFGVLLAIYGAGVTVFS